MFGCEWQFQSADENTGDNEGQEWHEMRWQVARTDVDAADRERQLVIGCDGWNQVGIEMRAAGGRSIERPGAVRNVWPTVHMRVNIVALMRKRTRWQHNPIIY